MLFLDKTCQDTLLAMRKPETFGEKVRALREAREMPLRKLAALLDIDQSTLSKIERDERKPNDELIAKISDLFKIDKKKLVITFLSDKVVNELQDQDCTKDILRAAERKLTYLKTQKINV